MIDAIQWFFSSPIAMMAFAWCCGAGCGYIAGRRQSTMGLEIERDVALSDLSAIRRAVQLTTPKEHTGSL